MSGIDRLAAVMGCDNDFDAVERDKLLCDAASKLARYEVALRSIAAEEPDAIGHSWGHTYVRKFVGIAKQALGS